MTVRTAAGTLLLLLAGMAAACLLGEAGARLLAPSWKPRTGDRELFWRPHPRWGWAHRAGAEGRFSGPAWDVAVRINSRGLRDREHEAAPPPGVRRVLLLGDSFGWGYGVEREEGVAARLEALCPDWEVVNASVSGWSTDQQYLFYRDEGFRYGADLVLLLVHENDLVGNSQARIYGYPKPRFALRADGLSLENVPVPRPRLRDRAYHWLMARSQLANGIFRATGVALAQEMPALAEGRPLVEPRVTERLLLRFAGELRAAGVETGWVLVPTNPKATELFRAAAQRAGVPLLDLAEAFAGIAPQRVRLPGDPHWNARGHAIAAAAIAREYGCARAAGATSRLPAARLPAGRLRHACASAAAPCAARHTGRRLR